MVELCNHFTRNLTLIEVINVNIESSVASRFFLFQLYASHTSISVSSLMIAHGNGLKLVSQQTVGLT